MISQSSSKKTGFLSSVSPSIKLTEPKDAVVRTSSRESVRSTGDNLDSKLASEPLTCGVWCSLQVVLERVWAVGHPAGVQELPGKTHTRWSWCQNCGEETQFPFFHYVVFPKHFFPIIATSYLKVIKEDDLDDPNYI